MRRRDDLVIEAEMPGIGPDKDVTPTPYKEGLLTVRVPMPELEQGQQPTTIAIEKD